MPAPRLPLNRDRILRSIVIAGGIGTLAIGVGRRRFDATVDQHVSELLASRSETSTRPVSAAEFEDLPDPVETYFEQVLDTGRDPIRTARSHQSGSFRLGGRDAPWRSLDATQYYTVQPPGFVWDATIDIVPFVSARVLDYYRHGDGVLDARLFGGLPVARAGPDAKMNAGELVRYLAEAVWFPTALLPRYGVEWTAIDDGSARASLDDQGVTATVVFHFDSDGLISRVTTDRYRKETDDYAPWTGYFDTYERRSGFLVPTEATVAWSLPDGDLPYWRATIDELSHAAIEDVAQTVRP